MTQLAAFPVVDGADSWTLQSKFASVLPGNPRFKQNALDTNTNVADPIPFKLTDIYAPSFISNYVFLTGNQLLIRYGSH